MSVEIMLLDISPWYLYPLVGCWGCSRFACCKAVFPYL